MIRSDLKFQEAVSHHPLLQITVNEVDKEMTGGLVGAGYV